MLATELLFVYVYCLVDDAIKTGVLSIPRRPGPAPDCTDAELLTIAVVRHLLGRRSENGFLAEIRRDWPGLFPHLPDQPEVNRRTRWLRAAFEQLRAAWAAAVPADPVQQTGTSALPVKHLWLPKTPYGQVITGSRLAARHPFVHDRVSCACASCSFSPSRYQRGCGCPGVRRRGRTPRSSCCATSWRSCSGRRRRGLG